MLDIYNITIMTIKRKVLLVSSILITLTILGFIVAVRGFELFKGLELFILILIIILGIVVFVNALRKERDIKAGLPVDDELSTRIKYKAGYYAYLTSMYMWLFIFLLKDNFPDVETMLGGGILLSAAISVIIKFVVKYKFDE
jgi:hypothetical protein